MSRPTVMYGRRVTPAGRSLRVGVLLDGPSVPAWVAWIVNAVDDHPDLDLALVVGTAPPSPDRRPLFRLYERIDRGLFNVEPDALATVDIGGALAGVPRAPESEIADHHLDVLLHLGGPRPRGAILDAPRYGVWSYRHGAALDAPLFREMARGVGDAETVLEVLRADGGHVIYRSTGVTDPVSLHRTRVPAYWKSAHFAMRRLEELANGRWEPSRAELPEPAAAPPAAPRTLRYVAAVATRVARRKLRASVFQHQWFLGFRRRTGDRLPQDDPAPWRLTFPPGDRSYADPFVVCHAGETFVFLEVLAHSPLRGELAVGRLDDDGALIDVAPVLPVAHHTSYPYVFEDSGVLYLIPESSAERRVDLFRATRFPGGWEHAATLLEDVNAVDATVYRHAGRYWMWVTIAVPGARLNEETFVYFSDRLDGGWTPHPGNPVVSDARRARPAGRPFLHDGLLIRPAQNCSGRYGRQVVFSVVEQMDPDRYSERPDGSLGPEWAGRPNLAAHTYTFDGEWEATDGLRTFTRFGPTSRSTSPSASAVRGSRRRSRPAPPCG